MYALITIFTIGIIAVAKEPRVQAVVAEWSDHSIWENVRRLVASSDLEIQGEDEDRINVLLLGQGGEGHDGPYLTDTIIVASLKPSTNQAALISVPRDLLVQFPDNLGYRKINSANAYGESKQPGSGAEFAVRTVEQALGLTIPYYARIDFPRFAKVIDELGGVEITVERSFTDTQFPSANNGYRNVSFEAGTQVMSGEQALDFVRSRHGSNGETSDFARSRRQQLLLLALKKKLLAPTTLLNPGLSLRLYRRLEESIETNISAGEAIRLASLGRDVDLSTIVTRVFDSSPDGLLRETIGIDGAYLLVPVIPDGSQLKQAARDVFAAASLKAEGAWVVVENGTTYIGLAESIKRKLEIQGVARVDFRNATTNSLPRSVIYDYSNGSKPLTKLLLQNLFPVDILELERGENSEQPDFTIRIGTNYKP